jgi:hypothetical protein
MIMLARNIILYLFIGAIVGGCTIVSFSDKPPQEKTQLQTRQFQTREFDTNNTDLILKAVLNVLQDDGFQVKNAVPTLGLLSAEKIIDLKNSNSNFGGNDFWSDFFRSMSKNKQSNTKDARYEKLKVIEATVNVTQYGSRAKVRANFQVKILDNNNNTIEVTQVEDAKFYQDFFVKVDKGVFLQKEGL